MTSQEQLLVLTRNVSLSFVLSLTLIGFLLPATNANAVFLGPEADIPSGVAYLACLANNPKPKKCLVILLDPPGDNITHITDTITYNPARVSITADASGHPIPLFFCDFSNDSSNCPPVIPVSPGITNPPPANFVVSGNRTNTTFTLEQPTLGTLVLDYDLSGNPADGTGERNFFGFGVELSSEALQVEYLDTPGSYDINFAPGSLVCSSGGVGTSCGPQGTPIFGINFVPEPSTLLLIASVGLISALTSRRRKSVAAD